MTVLSKLESLAGKYSIVPIMVVVVGVLAGHNVCWLPETRGVAKAVALEIDVSMDY